MQSTLCTARALCLSCTKTATHLAHLCAVVQRLLNLRLLPLPQAALMHPLLRPDAAAHGTSSTASCVVRMQVHAVGPAKKAGRVMHAARPTGTAR